MSTSFPEDNNEYVNRDEQKPISSNQTYEQETYASELQAGLMDDQQKSSALCVNLCDLTTQPIDDSGDILRLCQLSTMQAGTQVVLDGSVLSTDVKRIYVGSYFCDQLFLSLDDAFFAQVADFCRTCGVSATLVIPIFAQSTLASGLERINLLLETYHALFDEITVNDYGMAAYLTQAIKKNTASNIALNWGRLFMKEQRDPRHMQTSYGTRPCNIDAPTIEDLKERYPLSTIELDPFAPVIDLASIDNVVPVALHLPHCFMSTGHICEAASAPYAPEHSFRANMMCAQECCRSFTVSRVEAQTIGSTGRTCYLMKSGRTVFFENPSCRTEGGCAPTRIIWSPETFSFSLPEDPAPSWDTTSQTPDLDVSFSQEV